MIRKHIKVEPRRYDKGCKMAGETKKKHRINDGHADTGFFVIQITGDRLRAAYRLKSGIKSSKAPDGRKQHEWVGQWDWKWLLHRNISA